MTEGGFRGNPEVTECCGVLVDSRCKPWCVNSSLTQDECDAIGVDGRDGRGVITADNLTDEELVRLDEYRRYQQSV